jgi:BirA family biotin operon repressor/biotin-[acetyl-CoA-carboxylase] ligase
MGEKPIVLLGIGLNVEQESFPEEIAGIATSLRLHGITAERETVAAAILNKLEQMAEIFIEKGFARVRPLWIEANCTLGRNVTVETPGGKVVGKAINLDDGGGLLVETASGVRRVTTGDVLLGDAV